ncbi:MAG: hypothetical protein J6Q85_08080 [Clostridia bacterium]|nr:hypothetical protein [Clostridia bacterium]
MFGYVKPRKSELLVREFEFYRATYCGICRAMKRHTGALSNVTLSYDSVFLALVRMLYIEDGEFKAENKRCIAHPLSSRPMLVENEALIYTARAFAILAYHKTRDDLRDEGLGKRIALSTVSPIVAMANSKADLSELSKTAKDKLDKIQNIEDEKKASVDEGASLFGELLGEIFAFGLSEHERPAPYYTGYHLGRFIYAIDAAEDYDRDRKNGSYNPYVLMYGGEPLTDENRENIKCALLHECKKLEGAVNLLPFGTRSTIENIIRNVIYLGLTDKMKFLDGKSTQENEEKK